MDDWTGLAFPTLPCLGWLEPLILPREPAAPIPPTRESETALAPASDQRPAGQPAVS